MKLKIVKGVLWALVLLIGAALFGGAFMTGNAQRNMWIAMLLLSALAGVIGLLFLRCPKCGAHIHLYGEGAEECPRCGAKLKHSEK